jgi:hypothetical protein
MPFSLVPISTHQIAFVASEEESRLSHRANMTAKKAIGNLYPNNHSPTARQCKCDCMKSSRKHRAREKIISSLSIASDVIPFDLFIIQNHRSFALHSDFPKHSEILHWHTETKNLVQSKGSGYPLML